MPSKPYSADAEAKKFFELMLPHLLLALSIFGCWYFLILPSLTGFYKQVEPKVQAELPRLFFRLAILIAATIGAIWYRVSKINDLPPMERLRHDLSKKDRLTIEVAVQWLAFVLQNCYAFDILAIAILTHFPYNIVLLAAVIAPVVVIFRTWPAIQRVSKLQSYSKDFYLPLRFTNSGREPDRTIFVAGHVEAIHSPAVADRLTPFIRSQLVKAGATAYPNLDKFSDFDNNLRKAIIYEFDDHVQGVTVDLSRIQETYWKQKAHSPEAIVIGMEV